MLEVLAVSLNKTALTGFVVYLIGAVLLFMLFQFVYTRITPHKEFELIRSGNVPRPSPWPVQSSGSRFRPAT